MATGTTLTTTDEAAVVDTPGRLQGLPMPAIPAAGRSARLRRWFAAADAAAGAFAAAVASLADARPIDGRVVLAFAVGGPVLTYTCGLYTVHSLRAWTSGVADAPRTALAGLIASWPALGLLSAVGAPRPVAGALTAAAAWACLVGICRAAVRFNLQRDVSLRERVLVVGSGEVAKALVERMRRHPEAGLDPAGFVDGDSRLAGWLGVPYLGDMASLEELVARRRFERVVVAFSRASHEQLLACVRVCRTAGIPVAIVPRLFEDLDGTCDVDELAGVPLISLQTPSFSRPARVAKRSLDIVLASTMLVLLLPMMLMVALAILLESGRPVLFSQRRSGVGGVFFTLFKFRSMKTGSTVRVRPDGSIDKLPGDARVTRVGRWLRRSSFDEAPQLLNVLRGEMSLVGPRPLVQEEYDTLVEVWQSRRADLRPGLTGPWQVTGRSRLPFDEMIRLDYQYVAGWSLARDLKILFATVLAVIFGCGVY